MTDGSNAIALPQVLGVLGKRLHRSLPSFDSGLQRKHVLQLRASVLADMPEREIADIHPMSDKRTGDAEDIICGIVGAEFLIFSKDSDPFTLEQMPQGSFNQGQGFGGQVDDLLLAGLPPDANFDR